MVAIAENTRFQELRRDLSEFQRKHDADVANLDKRMMTMQNAMTSMENAPREDIAKVLSLENPLPNDPVASMTKFGKVDFPSYDGTDNGAKKLMH
ncbi:hypothetical protein SLEP1_g13319 [Rubroshorea leprosula]|uniref:Uncharacterized protein n=1 Tax=Rubroshorea leprosula TaxID=152421 RepID=A0AAV5IJX1_9ROSI|nr:hypothetical protein SLEP1_g13319 [Rubroshorea leprosula]